MANVEMYATMFCPYCARARALLEQKGVTWTEYDLDIDGAKRDEMVQRSGRRTVPQVFIDGVHVGGSDDLMAAERSGELDKLLGGAA